MTTTLYHTTDAADVILRDGFKPGTLAGGSGAFAGVFLASEPTSEQDGAAGQEVLAVTFPDFFDLTPYEVHEEGCAVWQWCVPVEVVRERAVVARGEA